MNLTAAFILFGEFLYLFKKGLISLLPEKAFLELFQLFPTFHESLQTVEGGATFTVFCHPVLRVIVGSDLFIPVARPNL